VKPAKEAATRNRQTYFVTTLTSERRSLFKNERWSNLFVEVLFRYRAMREFDLHEFVVMPNHVHLLLTPGASLERAVQLIKGGFSREASQKFEGIHAIWQRGFADHRIRDVEDYLSHREYIRQNPVKAGLCSSGYCYSSANPVFILEAIPQGLKPTFKEVISGPAEAGPFQR
jgi:putative transposase